MAPIFAMSGFGFATLLLAVAAIAFAGMYIFNADFRRAVNIKVGIGVNNLTTETQKAQNKLNQKKQKVVKAGNAKSDMKGTVAATQEELDAANTALATKRADLKLGKSMAIERIKAAKPTITDAELAVELNNDSTMLMLAGDVSLAIELVGELTKVVESGKKSVKAAEDAVNKAGRTIAKEEVKIKVDTVREKGADVKLTAADIIQDIDGINGVAGDNAEHHRKVAEKDHQADARLEDAQGPQERRDFEKQKEVRDLGGLINEA